MPRHSPPDSTVTINLEDDGEFILLSVDDEGSGVPQDISKTYFKKFSKGRINLAELALGFIFCRITVETWGGSIGYSPRELGSRFWFRLPKAVVTYSQPSSTSVEVGACYCRLIV